MGMSGISGSEYFLRTEEPNENTRAPFLIHFGGPRLHCSVAPKNGAILTSYAINTSRPTPPRDSEGATEGLNDREEFVELLFRGNDFSTTQGWDGKSPVLWPAVGRNFTSEQIDLARKANPSKPSKPGTCRFTLGLVDGAANEIPLHGFAQHLPWKLVEEKVEADRVFVVLSLDSSKVTGDSKLCYPFEYSTTLKYTVSEGTLTLDLEVNNLSDAESDMPMLPFSFGTHPTFKLPFVKKNFDWSEAYFCGTSTVDLKLNEFSCLSGHGVDHAKRSAEEVVTADKVKSVRLPVREFSDNVLGKASVFSKRPFASMTLVSPSEMMFVTVTQSLLGEKHAELHSEDLYMVMWGDEEAGFMCVEPWMGGPNSLNTGQGAILLQPGESFRMRHTYSSGFQHDRD